MDKLTLSDKEESGSSSEQLNSSDAAADVPTEHKSAFLGFLQTLTTFSGDLSQITAPAFLLNGISLLEYSSHWCDFPHILAAVSEPENAGERMVAVTRWFISTLYGSYYERCSEGSEKKPYNPILGEEFFCCWDEKQYQKSINGKDTRTKPLDGRTGWQRMNLVVEQVSHHPPISAFHISCPSLDIKLNGHCGQKSKFKSMTVKVEQTGRALLEFMVKQDGQKTKEKYFVNLPELTIRGIFSGKIFLELCGSVTITSSSGYVSQIDFIPKPWFYGEYHNIKGSIYCNSTGKTSKSSQSIDCEYSISGKWAGKSIVTKRETGEETLLFDFDAASPRPDKLIKTPSSSRPLESRQVWGKVSKMIETGDLSGATKEKASIEQKQREIRKDRERKGEIWTPKYFEFVQDCADGEDKPKKKSSGSLPSLLGYSKGQVPQKYDSIYRSSGGLTDIGGWKMSRESDIWNDRLDR